MLLLLQAGASSVAQPQRHGHAPLGQEPSDGAQGFGRAPEPRRQLRSQAPLC